MTEKKERHKFMNRHPLAGPLLTALFFVLLLLLIDVLITIGIVALTGMDRNNAGYLALIITAFVLMLIYRLWFRGEFTGFGNAKHMGRALLLMLPFFALWISDFVEMKTNGVPLAAPEIEVVLAGLSAGILEEVFFRGVLMSSFLRDRELSAKTGRVVFYALITSVLFGAVHVLNGVSGSLDYTTAVKQAGYAVISGLALTVIYSITGSLVPVIVIHAVHDIIVTTAVNCCEAAGYTTEGIWTYTTYIYMGAMGLIALLMLIGQRRSIVARWTKKWRKGDVA